MIIEKILLLLIFTKVFGDTINDSISTELDDLFADLTLPTLSIHSNSYVDKETFKMVGFVDDCIGYDPIFLDVSVSYLKVYFFVDNYIQSERFFYQIRCYLRALKMTKMIKMIVIENTNINDFDCKVVKKMMGKSRRNEIYFMIFGVPLFCHKFAGLGTFIMFNPVTHGRPLPIENHFFKIFKKSMIEEFNDIVKSVVYDSGRMIDPNIGNCLKLLCQKVNFSYDSSNVSGNIEQNNEYKVLEKKYEERYMAFLIRSHFTVISEVIQIDGDTIDERLNEDSLKSLLKYLFVFSISQYKQNIEIVGDQSSDGSFNDIKSSRDDYEFATWMVNNAFSLIPITLLIGVIVAGVIFFIQKKQHDVHVEEKKAVFKRGIRVLYDIKRSMDLESSTTTESELETSDYSIN